MNVTCIVLELNFCEKEEGLAVSLPQSSNILIPQLIDSSSDESGKNSIIQSHRVKFDIDVMNLRMNLLLLIRDATRSPELPGI